MSADARRGAFRALHEASEIFVMPNAWDLGSARMIAGAGARALATTSAGFAWTIGKDDRQITLDELVAHVTALAAATPLPLSVDSERLYADSPSGVAESVERLAAAGAAGCSIEDYDPARSELDDMDVAAERVAAAAAAASRLGLTLTARAERHLFAAGAALLDDTIARLRAYRDAGAHCLYAPGLRDPADIARVVEALDGAPLNVLLLPGMPSVAELGRLGARRISTGSLLASGAYAAGMAAVRTLLSTGASEYVTATLDREDRQALGA